jgi:ankyrin repeat protein
VHWCVEGLFLPSIPNNVSLFCHWQTLKTPLHLATEAGFVDGVRALLRAGAAFDAVDAVRFLIFNFNI